MTETVTDSNGNTASASGTVTSIGDPNCCPALSPVSDFFVPEGASVHFSAFATDFEGDSPIYALSGDLPSGAEISLMGQFTWHTQRGDAGNYTAFVHVSQATLPADPLNPGPCDDAQQFVIHVRPLPPVPSVQDTDLDGVSDSSDNCPSTPNSGQADADHDGNGDACDGTGAPTAREDTPPAPSQPATPPDSDLDGVVDAADNCPAQPNRGQSDVDGDRLGDACDADQDGDQVVDTTDDCPRAADPKQPDVDADGVGDACQAAIAAGCAECAPEAPVRSRPQADPAAAQQVQGVASGLPVGLAASLLVMVLVAVPLVLVLLGRRRSQR
ncbi:MAG: thrombospondin type 3 repeat-containing protein [Halobacteriales archaeon]|nr:thrombospondin type 3 repeat-containing protein [Halobacteriales archaeon]